MKMVRYIQLKPASMTSKIMQKLESDGFISYRFTPGRETLDVPKGEGKGRLILSTEDKYGPLKIISITSNKNELDIVHMHPDYEVFLPICDSDAKPLYLVVALCGKDELLSKVESKTLSEKDFIALKVKFNDVKVSFFVVNKHKLHAETSNSKDGTPPSFYVLEPRDMGGERLSLGEYRLMVQEDKK